MFIPSKNALARSCKKRSFFLAPLQDPAGSCGILQEFCRNLAGFLHEIPARFLQNPTRSRKIPQDLARSCKILQGCKKKGPFLARSCKSVFTGLGHVHNYCYPSINYPSLKCVDCLCHIRKLMHPQTAHSYLLPMLLMV